MEQTMFTRHVTMKLRANSAAEFTRIIENEIIPLLRKQKGFRDEVTFVAPGRSEAVASSFWDTKEDAEAYGRWGYQEVLKTLSKAIEGTPKIETFEVANSTFHKIAAKGA
jgi:heme-degrading monooxygenase HmoA